MLHDFPNVGHHNKLQDCTSVAQIYSKHRLGHLMGHSGHEKPQIQRAVAYGETMAQKRFKAQLEEEHRSEVWK